MSSGGKIYCHLNWGACGDWLAVRCELQFLNTTLFGNFCDVFTNDVNNLKRRIEARGFKVMLENYDDGTKAGRPLLRLYDQPPPPEVKNETR